MKSVAVALFLCAFGAASAGASAGHPIEKVIKMIDGLKEKAIMEGKDEEVAFTKFQYWCSTSIDTVSDAIKEEKELIDELTDKIAGLEKEKASLEDDIKELEDQLLELEASAKAAKKARDKEAKLYKKANEDTSATIKGIEGCIEALEKAESTTEPKMMLLARSKVKAVLSLVSLKVTEHQRQSLEAYGKPKQLAKGDLAKHTDKYDFKSENVIELLKQLKLKFEDDKLADTKAETNAINAYDLAKAARDNAIDAAEKSKKQKNTELGKTKAEIKSSQKTKEDTEKDLAADEKTLSDTQESCKTKTSEWEKRSKTRSLEIEAMDTAMKILSKTTKVRTEAPGNPVPPPNPVKFLQLSSVVSPADPKMKAVSMLLNAAKQTHSRALERLAVEVQAHLKGPFTQVNNMIEKMIFRLMDEQKQEDEHKLWCDQEIKKTETMKEDKEDKISDLKAEIKVENAAVGKLTEEIKDANKMISDITTFMKEATEIRNTGKKENDLAIKDSKAAQDSLTNAIAVLTAFYKESGEVPKEPWEFIQEPQKLPEKPSTWDSGYTGVADPDKQPGGIISVLETILTDFENMEADTKAQEATDQKEYEEAIQDNKIEKASRTQEVDMKTAEKARRVEKISSLEGQKKNTNAELEKTDQYLADLQKPCVNGDSSYEDRKAARSKEIKALKDAKQTLADAFKSKMFLQIRQHVQ